MVNRRVTQRHEPGCTVVVAFFPVSRFRVTRLNGSE